MKNGLVKRPLGRTGVEVTFVGFGALEIGRDWGLVDPVCPEEGAAMDVISGVVDLGVNLIDTASAYHLSETRIGKAIGGSSVNVFLATKCGEHNCASGTYYDFSYQAIMDSIEQSRRLLQVSEIDLMQIHFGPKAQEVLDDGETLRALRDAQAAGWLRFLGASAAGEIAQQCIESGDFDVMQMTYNLLDRRDEALLERCAEKNIGVLIKGGLARGQLTQKVVSCLAEVSEPKRSTITKLLNLVDGDGERLTALALHFLHRNPHISSVLLGSKNLAHLRSNLECLDNEIADDLLDSAGAITNEMTQLIASE